MDYYILQERKYLPGYLNDNSESLLSALCYLFYTSHNEVINKFEKGSVN